jgi:hypothetical protein
MHEKEQKGSINFHFGLLVREHVTQLIIYSGIVDLMSEILRLRGNFFENLEDFFFLHEKKKISDAQVGRVNTFHILQTIRKRPSLKTKSGRNNHFCR